MALGGSVSCAWSRTTAGTRRLRLGASAIAHYEFLLRWTRDRDWTEPCERPVVFLPVGKTAELRGLTEGRVRQLEYELNEAGLLTWTDRGDYRRGGKRDADGLILFAHGVDLSPGVAMFPELLKTDARRRKEIEERTKLRTHITKLKGSVRPLLDRAIEDGLIEPGKAEWRNTTGMLSTRTDGNTPPKRLKETAAKLDRLRARLSGRVEANAHSIKALGGGCGKARKACGRTRKTIGASIENYRPTNTTRNQQTDKSVTSTPCCGQSTAWGGNTDAPSGAKSSIETIDGREKGGRGLEARKEPPKGDHDANAERGRVWRQAGTVVDGLAGNPRAKGGGTANGPDSSPGRPPKGQLWKPDTGTRHISLLNAVEIAGMRLRNRIPRTEQTDWDAIEDAAEDLCPELGISLRAWWMAVTIMGRRAAAVCVMIIDRKMCPMRKTRCAVPAPTCAA